MQKQAIKFFDSALRRIFTPISILLVRTRFGRAAIYSAMPKNELLIANTNEGLHYIVNTSDKIIGRSLFRNKKSFDSHNLEQSLKIIGKEKNILLDVGANIGTIGIFALSKGLATKCIAFEPEPYNFKLLKANIDINDLTDKFELHNIALADQPGKPLQFELSKSNFGDHRIHIGKNRNETKNRKIISVETNSLDNICADIDLNDCILFMDTQGFEGHILIGGKKFLNASVPMVTEFSPHDLLRTDGLDKFYTALADAKYTAMYDLKHPNTRINFSIEAIKKLQKKLERNKKFTDLLFLKE